jgi:hypothetical protein
MEGLVRYLRASRPPLPPPTPATLINPPWLDTRSHLPECLPYANPFHLHFPIKSLLTELIQAHQPVLKFHHKWKCSISDVIKC